MTMRVPGAAFALAMIPATAFAQGVDPAGSGPIVSALGWLQGTLLGLNVGETTPPFGSLEDGVRALVVCGRDEAEAAGLLPPDAVAFLATGRQSLPAWVASFRSARAHLRVIDPPIQPFPLPGGWLVGRPPFDVASEAATFQALGVTRLVAKDAGGREGRGKLDAAGALGLPVILLRRPAPPEGMRCVATVEAALDWAAALPFRSSS